MEAGKEVEGEGVEEQKDEVGEGTMLAQAEVMELQAVGLTPDTDGKPGQQQGSHEHDDHDECLEAQGQQAEVGEQEQCQKAHQREVLGAEDTGEGACAPEECFVHDVAIYLFS